jgi:3-deoxy-D-arabino-heptulosonate 7-phosphate (DAHP) synthase
MFDLRAWFRNPNQPLYICGPCSVETEQQLLQTALALSQIPEVKVLRGGIWKPRTRPMPFEGVGEVGLGWMLEAKRLTNLLTMTEVATAKHVELCLKHDVDVLWIGARTVVNPFSVSELASSLKGCDIPVFIKNPIAPDLKLWLGAFERLAASGLTCLGAIHRGFQNHNEAPYRNNPLWEIPIELHRLRPDIPIVTDISHICGRRGLLSRMAQKAINMATDGFMIETHIDPDAALTDAAQQITPEQLKQLLHGLVMRSKSVGVNQQILNELREQIDQIDDDLLLLLSKRMKISAQIGEHKKAHNITVLQIDRWKKILSEHIESGKSLGLDPAVVTNLFEIIHQASIEKQTDILDDSFEK